MAHNPLPEDQVIPGGRQCGAGEKSHRQSDPEVCNAEKPICTNELRPQNIHAIQEDFLLPRMIWSNRTEKTVI
jgi:hypothetical protein